MFRIISALSLTLVLSSTAMGQSRILGTVDVLETTTVDELDSLNGVEVRSGKIFVFGNKSEQGRILEFSWQDNKLTRTGYDNGITLDSNRNSGITNPTGITYHETMGTFIGNSTGKSSQLFFVDWDILKNSRKLDWATLNVVEDDLAANSSIPEFVYFKNEWLIATADTGLMGTTIRLYDPFALQQAKKTSDQGVLRYSFTAPAQVTHLHWRNDSGELLLSKHTPFGGWKLVSILLEESIEAETAIENSIVVLPNRIDRLRGFHHLFGTHQAVAVSSGLKGNFTAIRLETYYK